jgi:hypothetical protein
MMIEAIPDEDEVSRHIDSPLRFSAAEQRLIERQVFQFPSDDGNRESLIWRKYKPTLAELHAMGCERQAHKRTTNPGWTYEGAITIVVGAIRQLRNRMGNGFVVEHDPEEGTHHVTIRFSIPEGYGLKKAEKSELKDMLVRAFRPIDRHSCA